MLLLCIPNIAHAVECAGTGLALPLPARLVRCQCIRVRGQRLLGPLLHEAQLAHDPQCGRIGLCLPAHACLVDDQRLLEHRRRLVMPLQLQL
eukprot:scaffold1650_cov351-Prasinococcus_capsulatus_cf.AAC.5